MSPEEAIAAAASPERPVLIAGPTASGKSELAMRIVRAHGGIVVNADALQVYANWRILTARPSAGEEAALPHALFGHVPGGAPYSAGHWLRAVAPYLDHGPRPVIVGGTGLYFAALTAGLAPIPAIPPVWRQRSGERLEAEGLCGLLRDIDARTASRLDRRNPARLRRAWEVAAATGRGLADWQDDTPPPLLAPRDALCLVMEAPKAMLDPRIEARFDAMLARGALDEVRANLPGWDAARPDARAIGAPELAAHLRGEITLEEAREAAILATRRYAKRQRTWFRARMADWTRIAAR
ncbi:tRNA (adenosine(37)-N6)-dimethylallyltransferase MiaA [Profundibacterium mesophilum]|uniref:tRNA dimethylallyltransferase n=1 Tax=Profundibacterium mesophilum KAUST100406-0324 TaxID=1037889 RepID=A0A921NU23_9RHOB|nr:tRNA (adenosine(37)-N6)-dimethylallyltransferase MiaA [Profundibacterium mesophilum]KAF0675206.1 tRNA dimethylallyltransferase [Profundibacterium mesophilum KAUST100406-0324]